MPDVWPAGSYVLALDGTPEKLGLTLASRNMARHLRIGPARRDYADASYTHLVAAFPGIGLRPLSPVHLRASPQGADLALRWIRRSRLAADSWDAPEIPLGEEVESYAVRVFDGTTLLREAQVSTAHWTYSAADQAADGGTAPLRVEVAQISAIYGAGAWARLDL